MFELASRLVGVYKVNHMVSLTTLLIIHDAISADNSSCRPRV